MPAPTHGSYSLFPIGQVRVEEDTGFYAVEVFEPFRAGLALLDQFSHVTVIWWADRHDCAADRAILTTDLPYAPGVECGVFACRSEYRPNPIALTTMPILGVDCARGLVLLPWLDAAAGSPVLDLKPYLPVSDRIRDVQVAGWMQDWPVWMEDAGAFFATHATNLGS
jgi:tRNA (Thr-GGU) A37 N-methylase